VIEFFQSEETCGELDSAGGIEVFLILKAIGVGSELGDILLVAVYLSVDDLDSVLGRILK